MDGIKHLTKILKDYIYIPEKVSTPFLINQARNLIIDQGGELGISLPEAMVIMPDKWLFFKCLSTALMITFSIAFQCTEVRPRGL